MTESIFYYVLNLYKLDIINHMKDLYKYVTVLINKKTIFILMVKLFNEQFKASTTYDYA